MGWVEMDPGRSDGREFWAKGDGLMVSCCPEQRWVFTKNRGGGVAKMHSAASRSDAMRRAEAV